MRVSVVFLAILIGVAATVSCGNLTAACPAILYIRPTLPDTTTIRVGASTIAIAGASWGGCESGPPPPDFVWRASDSSVVAVTEIDSLRASIQGRRPGKAIVTPTSRSEREAPRPVTVTVVP